MDTPSAAAVKVSAEGELASLEALLAAARPGESVHGARRRIKQLRSLLRLLRPGIGKASYSAANAALRRAADGLAGSRRAEALVAAAAKLEKGKAEPGFWQGLALAHRVAHAAEDDPAAMLKDARVAIAEAARDLAGARLVTEADALSAGAYMACYAEAQKRLRRALKHGRADDLHEARKHVIHHLHHLQRLQPGRAGRLAALERLREQLGDLNDLDELEQLADGISVAAREARRMRKARGRLLGRVERAAHSLFRRKPENFARWSRNAAKPRSPRQAVALQAGE